MAPCVYMYFTLHLYLFSVTKVVMHPSQTGGNKVVQNRASPVIMAKSKGDPKIHHPMVHWDDTVEYEELYRQYRCATCSKVRDMTVKVKRLVKACISYNRYTFQNLYRNLKSVPICPDFHIYYLLLDHLKAQKITEIDLIFFKNHRSQEAPYLFSLPSSGNR